MIEADKIVINVVHYFNIFVELYQETRKTQSACKPSQTCLCSGFNQNHSAVSLLQVLKDVEMEPLGRKSGDSFRSMSSYRESGRGRSYKKQLEQKATKTRAAEKVRKHNMRKCEIS